MAKLKLVAHYVVPTYNLVGNIAQTHVIRADYYGEKVDIDVWLANATLGDEEKSMLSSFANQRSLCEIQQGFAPSQIQRTMATRDIRFIDNIVMMLKKPEFKCSADEKLKSVLAEYLDKMHAVYNLEQSVLVAGFSK